MAAIRRHDRRHLITIGLLPSSVPLIGPARQYSGFAPGRLAPYLDFLAIHLYPQQGGAAGGGADFVLDGPALLTSGAARAETLDAYGALRGGALWRQGQQPPGVRWAGVEPRGPGSNRE